MDVYAVGALLAHLLPGRTPDGDLGSGGPALPGLPLSFVPMIARAMAANPSQRTPSAEALGRELDVLAERLKGAPSRGDELPPEERTWRGADALLAAMATAVALYAALVSATPRPMPIDDALPFTAFGDDHLADSRALTRARLELQPS